MFSFFRWPWALQNHIRVRHLAIKNWRCKICYKRFSSKKHMTDHISCVHEKIKKYTCTYKDCDFKAGRPNTLKEHIDNRHLKIKPYKCEKCKFASGYFSSLKVHMKIHESSHPKS